MSKHELHHSRRRVGGGQPAASPRSSLRSHVLAWSLATVGFTLTSHAQELEVVDTFTAFGQGESRANNALNFEDLEALLPGMSLEKSIDLIPGVNVSTSDPFGFYEWGADIRLRSFNISQIAVTVDGVAMGNNDPRYGTRASRVVDNENISEIVVNQGTGALGTPAYEALGGSINYQVRRPSQEMGVLFKYTIGDFDTERFFGRFDTGEILPGLTAYVSASDFEFLTRGTAYTSSRDHVDVVVDYQMERANFSLQFGLNDRDDFDTNSAIQWDRWRALETGVAPSDDALAQLFAEHGYVEYDPHTFGLLNGGFNNGDYSDAGRNLGPPAYLDGNVGPGEGINAIYHNLWRNGRIDKFTRLVFDIEATDTLTLAGNTYYQDKDNYGLWGVTKSAAEAEVRAGYAADPDRTDIWAVPYYNAAGQAAAASGETYVDLDGNGAFSPDYWVDLNDNGQVDPAETEFVEEFGPQHALAAAGTAPGDPFVDGIPGRNGRDEDFGGHRYGVNLNFTWEEFLLPNNTLTFGGWYEVDSHNATRPNMNLSDGGAVFGWFLYDQVLFNNYTRAFESTHTMFYIGDEISLMDDRLTVVAGFSSLKVDRELDGTLNNIQWQNNETTSRDVVFEDNFLPQLGLIYQLTPAIELFTNYSESLSAPGHGTMTGNDFSEALQPESATNYDIGMRYTGSAISFSAQAYFVEYNDRILALPQAPGESSFTAGDTEYQNVGGVDSYGFELGYEWSTPIENLTLVGSLAIQETTFQEDLFTGARVQEAGDPGIDSDPSDGFYEVQTGTDGATGNPIFSQYAAIDGNDLGNTPFLVINTDLLYRISDFNLRFGGKYFDDIYVNTLNTEPVSSYFISSASITWQPGPDSSLSGLSLTLAAENVFDEEIWYASSYNDQTGGSVFADRGRNIYATVQARF